MTDVAKKKKEAILALEALESELLLAGYRGSAFQVNLMRHDLHRKTLTAAMAAMAEKWMYQQIAKKGADEKDPDVAQLRNLIEHVRVDDANNRPVG